MNSRDGDGEGSIMKKKGIRWEGKSGQGVHRSSLLSAPQ